MAARSSARTRSCQLRAKADIISAGGFQQRSIRWATIQARLADLPMYRPTAVTALHSAARTTPMRADPQDPRLCKRKSARPIASSTPRPTIRSSLVRRSTGERSDHALRCLHLSRFARPMMRKTAPIPHRPGLPVATPMGSQPITMMNSPLSSVANVSPWLFLIAKTTTSNARASRPIRTATVSGVNIEWTVSFLGWPVESAGLGVTTRSIGPFTDKSIISRQGDPEAGEHPHSDPGADQASEGPRGP
jgi:hypothetical protein